MRTRGGIAALVGTMLVASHAFAEETAPPPPEAKASPAVEQPTILDRLFGVRAFRNFAREVLTQIVDERRAEFDRITDRYTRLVEFTRHLEERDEAEFEARAARYERLRAFTRKLEAEQAERETRAFEAQVELAVRERAFTRELERRRAESAGPADVPAVSPHLPLYQRE